MSNAHSSHRIFHVKAFYQTTRSLVCATYLSLWFAAIRPFKCPIKLFFFINFSQVQVSLRPMITDMRAELGFLIMLWHKNIQSGNITQKSWRITSLQSPLADQSAWGQFWDQNLLSLAPIRARWIFSEFLLLAATLRFNIKVICPIYWGCNLLMRRFGLSPTTGTQRTR